MLKRCLIYVRVSTEDQVEKYGLPAQLRACREYAQAKGYEVILEIADEGISGAVLERPGLDRLRQMVREKGADVIVALDPDRLSRELAHLLILKPEIEKHASLEFVAVVFENTPTGKLFFSMKGAIAEYERAVTRDRTMRGKRERARSGRRVGGRVAFGYQDVNGQLKIVEDRAAVARQIFTWYDSGLSMCEITRRLRASGVSTWSGKPWWYTAVRAILSNEVYTGIGHWGSERIVIPVPAIVTRAQWDRVQARLADNPTANAGRPSTEYLLRGLLHCHCGRKMYGELAKSGNRRYPWYRCQSRNKTLALRPYCGCAVSAAKLDAAAWSAIIENLTDAEHMRGLIRQHEATVRPVAPDRLQQLEGQADKLRRREQTSLALMSDPDLIEDRHALKRQYLDAQGERRRVEGEIAAARRVTCIRDGSWIDEAADLIRRYVVTITAPSQKQEYVRGLVSRAVWSGEELKMSCFIGLKPSSSLREIDGFPDRVGILLTARIAA